MQIVASKLGLSTGRTTHQATANSVGRNGPTISGPFNLVSYSHGDKLRLGSQESSLEGGNGGQGDKTKGRVRVDENHGANGLDFEIPDSELGFPPRPYAKSHLDGYGRHVLR